MITTRRFAIAASAAAVVAASALWVSSARAKDPEPAARYFHAAHAKLKINQNDCRQCHVLDDRYNVLPATLGKNHQPCNNADCHASEFFSKEPKICVVCHDDIDPNVKQAPVVRQRRDSEFGGVSTGAVAAGYRLGAAWRVQASVGTAFRAPSLYQRFSDSGKASLRPEKGRNAELGLHYAAGRDEFGVTAYRNLVRDLIIYSAPGACLSPWGCYDNVSEGRLQGLSLRGATVLGAVRLSGTLDLQAPKDSDEASINYGKLLARRAKTHGSLRAETDVGAWTLGGQVLASSKRTDNLSTGYRLGGYALLDLDAQVAMSRQLSLQFKVENVFDRKYETARTYATAPRQVFIGLRFTPTL